jgi:DNA helicase-2/ATP-dependent DNA helicase PcrA
MWAATRQLIETRSVSARAANALQAFVDLIEQLDADTINLEMAELADHVIKVSGLLEFHKKEKGEKGLARVENLEELVSACRGFEPEDDEMTPLQEFLDSAALDAGESQADEFEDCVQMMTLHSAKGLEFPYVFMAGMEENLFPHRMSMEDPGRLEEERRLCYVGITRAMVQLFMSYAEVRRMHGNDTFNSASRFLREVPAELLHEVRMKSRTTAHSTPSYNRGSSATRAAEIPDTGYYLGQRVMHGKFGDGTVLNFEGQGSSARIQVNFDDEGSKWLVLSYAKLQAI